MSDSRYKGSKRFNRDQLVFVAEVILCSALNKVEMGLPDTVNYEDRVRWANGAEHTRNLLDFEHGAVEAAGMALAVFYAQLTDDGLEIYDALRAAGDFLETVEKFVKKAWANQGRNLKAAEKRLIGNGSEPYHISKLYGPFGYPDVHKHAETFVEDVFVEYLKGKKASTF